MTPVVSIAQIVFLPSPPDGRGHRSDADDIEDSAEIVDECGEAELAADIVEAPHQEGALVHPLLDRAERVLNGLAAPVEKFGPGPQALGHPIQHRLVLQARDPSNVCRAARSLRTGRAGGRIAVVDLLQIARLAVVVRRQGLPGRAGEDIPVRAVAELVLAVEAVADR